MDTNERVIQALHEFENMTDADKVLTQELEDVFIEIAHTGRIQIPWIYLKPVFMFKLDKVMRDFFESSPSRNSTSSEPTHTAEFDVMRQRLLDCIESFTSAPFTVQRLCELMIEPKRHYKSSDKFMRGVEKNVLVVSTMADIEGEELTNNHENTSIPNGPVTNGIISTASATEMTSVTDCESNGKHSEYYHDTHYPTTDELQHLNGNATQENVQVNEERRIEEEKSIEDEVEEKPSEQGNDTENKTTESEDILKDKCSDDGSSPELLEQPSKELYEQEGANNTENEEDKSTNNSEEEKSIENKEDTKEDLIGQADEMNEKNKDSKQDDIPEVNCDVPMEEN